MADTLDLKKLSKHKISTSLRSKSILIFGSPKIGKSTFAAGADKVLFFNFEDGTEFLPLDTEPIPIQKWTELKAYVKQLRDPEIQQMYHTIVIDTVTIAAQLCEQYICLQNGVTHIRDIPWGQGFSMPATEFFNVFHEISMLGYGIIFLAHTKTQNSEYMDEKGEYIQQVTADVDKRIFSVLNGMCDIIAYAEKQYDPQTKTMERVLYTDADAPDKVTGGRCAQFFPKVIPLSYKVFEEELEKAVKKIAETTHSELQDVSATVMRQQKSFEDALAEARTLWTGYLGAVDTEEEKEQRLLVMQDIIKRIFGKPIKLSAVAPSQQELLELVISEFKNL